MLILSLSIAAAMLAVVGAAYRSGSGALTCALALFGAFVFLGTQSPLLLGTWFLLMLLAVVCRCARLSTKAFVTWSAAVTLLTHSIVIVVFLPRMREIRELQREYPIVSVRDRMAYEKRALETTATEPAAARDANQPEDGRASAAQATRLSELEERLVSHGWDDSRRGFRYRNMALQRLYGAHQSAVGAFINAPGFGVGRMANFATPTRGNIEIPPISPVPQPQITPQTPLPSSDDGMPPLQAVDSQPEDASPLPKALTFLHMKGTLDFANPASFGYVRDVDHVIGFQPHAFRALPQMSETAPAITRWKIGKLELVSLLRHEQPQVYQSKNLPNMQELAEVPTRPLDDFESSALKKLRSGDDLVVASGSSEIRMLGSLRAAKQCLECHQVERGTLLGAFTYRLFSDPPEPQPKAEQPPRKPAS
ncbi:MAG: hypothetical protein WD648_01870 [Planctomycetaceae bacterium]